MHMHIPDVSKTFPGLFWVPRSPPTLYERLPLLFQKLWQNHSRLCTSCYTDCKYLAHSWQCKHWQTVFSEPYRKLHQEHRISDHWFCPAPQDKGFWSIPEHLPQIFTESKELKASSKLPDSCIPPPIALALYGREKNPKKSTRKPNKKPNLELVRSETRKENVEVGKISLPHTYYIVKMSTTGSAVDSRRM